LPKPENVYILVMAITFVPSAKYNVTKSVMKKSRTFLVPIPRINFEDSMSSFLVPN
jgi:hypothetical protein